MPYEKGNFKTERVNPLLVIYFKAHKWHRLKFTCIVCGQESLGIVKSENEILSCPNRCEIDDDEGESENG